MILIADSGATKTEWVVLNGNYSESKFFSTGINPYFIDFEGIKQVVEEEILPETKRFEISKIEFYGAGCSTKNKTEMVKLAFQEYFKNTQINIEHDILASARALCGNEKGIACILGTGSNACLYDGKQIVENLPSYGYLFGDEGSGAFMGKILLYNIFKNKISKNIVDKFYKKYNFSNEQILDNLYNKPKPNKFLASFSPFLTENIEHSEVVDIVRVSFQHFIDEQVKKYTNYKLYDISFVGSIAYHFSDILKEVVAKNQLKSGKILKSPMPGLIEYYLK